MRKFEVEGIPSLGKNSLKQLVRFAEIKRFPESLDPQGRVTSRPKSSRLDRGMIAIDELTKFTPIAILFFAMIGGLSHFEDYVKFRKAMNRSIKERNEAHSEV